MAEVVSPITRQVTKGSQENVTSSVDINLRDVEDCLIYDRHGVSVPFKTLYQDRKSVIIFVRASKVSLSLAGQMLQELSMLWWKWKNEEIVSIGEDRGINIGNFLCYSCKEYVDDLSKIPREVLEDAEIRLVVIGQSARRHIEPFCLLTGYPYEIYVDPERCIYRKLGLKREETFTDSAHPSPHVKSGVFMGQMKSIWRAMTSPAFDFQGDLHQQGGAIIVGPGSQIHFSHFDMNHLDHMPINWLLQLAGVQQTIDFSDKPKIIHV